MNSQSQYYIDSNDTNQNRNKIIKNQIPINKRPNNSNKNNNQRQKLGYNISKKMLNKMYRNLQITTNDQKSEIIRLRNKVKNCQPKSGYLKSLLNPEIVHDAKIPGTAVSTVAIHRKIIQRFAVNANGCFALNFTPENSYHENTLNNVIYTFVPVRYCNAATYNGTQSCLAGELSITSATNPFATPEGSVKQFRLVSASITVRSLASNLNKSGDIHIALVHGKYDLANTVSALPDEVAYTALPNINNLVQGKYAQASVENGEIVRGIWMPHDIDCLTFKDVNVNAQYTDNFISVIGIGLASSSTIEVVTDYNWEVTPKVGSLLAGMESFCKENYDPTLIWKSAYTKRPVCQAVTSVFRSAAALQQDEVVVLEGDEQIMSPSLEYHQKQYANVPGIISESSLNSYLNNNKKIDF